MKLAKSLLLGATAAVVSVAAANAADLPSRTKGPAVEYVKICDWITAEGFYVIPGTDTCIHVGGYVRAQYDIRSTANAFTGSGIFGVATGGNQQVGGPGTAAPIGFSAVANWARSQQNQGASARGTAVLDARTRTSYGTLRAVMALEANQGWGTLAANGAGITGNSQFNVDKAFIQWAGITAGRAESFFEFFDNVADNTYAGLRGSANSSELFAYTATFGGGFQATLSVENPVARNTGILQATGTGVGGAILTTNVATAGTILASRAPDVVGALFVEQSWGSAQLSGAWHQSSAQLGTGAIGNAFRSKTVSGFAVLGGVKINLPMLAAGDFLLLQAAYANGATNYLGYGGSANNVGASFLRSNSDFFLNTATGQTQREKGYNLIVEARHYWMPTVYQEVFGSYTKITPGSNAKMIDWTVGGIGTQTEWRLGTQVVWVPVKNFSIGLEGMYVNTKNTLAGVAPLPATAPAGYKASYDGFIGRLRINRSF